MLHSLFAAEILVWWLSATALALIIIGNCEHEPPNDMVNDLVPKGRDLQELLFRRRE